MELSNTCLKRKRNKNLIEQIESHIIKIDIADNDIVRKRKRTIHRINNNNNNWRFEKKSLKFDLLIRKKHLRMKSNVFFLLLLAFLFFFLFSFYCFSSHFHRYIIYNIHDFSSHITKYLFPKYNSIQSIGTFHLASQSLLACYSRFEKYLITEETRRMIFFFLSS